MPDPDPWLALAARARAALPAPSVPSLAALAADARRDAGERVDICWWPRVALLATAALVIIACLLLRAERVPSPFGYDDLEAAWLR